MVGTLTLVQKKAREKAIINKKIWKGHMKLDDKMIIALHGQEISLMTDMGDITDDSGRLSPRH